LSGITKSTRSRLSRGRRRYPRVSLELAGRTPEPPCNIGDVLYLDIRVTNTGNEEIDPSRADLPDLLSYHWSSNGKRQQWEPLRTPLPGPLAPGESTVATMRVLVSVQDRDAVLDIDMVRESAFWYADVGGNALELRLPCSPLGEAEPPVPPEKLMYAVGYTTDTAWFIGSGYLAASSMRDILERNGADIERMEAVLDFGCGAGRVLRHLRGIEGVALYGSDYNSDLISWCADNLTFASFETNPPSGRLAYEDAGMDLVYAFSVFTHLTEPQQTHWTDELYRVLKPGGYLLFSVHGESAYFKHLSPDEQERFKSGELIVQSDDQAGTNVCGAFHPEAYVRERMARDFIFLDYVPEGALGNPWQDIVLLKKP
jgi:SAM-dependent methyltransferase